jgi:hypothetical protein
MLEMKVAMRAALKRYTLQPSGEFERTRRRAITISPRRGARTVLLAREPVQTGRADNGAAAAPQPVAATE